MSERLFKAPMTPSGNSRSTPQTLVMAILWQFCHISGENTAMPIMHLLPAFASFLLSAPDIRPERSIQHDRFKSVRQRNCCPDGSLSLVEPAFALATAPAPLVGAGLPGLAVLGVVYGAMWLTRKLRNRRGTD